MSCAKDFGLDLGVMESHGRFLNGNGIINGTSVLDTVEFGSLIRIFWRHSHQIDLLGQG